MSNRTESCGPHGHDHLDEIRTRLAGQSGPKYWRSIDELADTDEFRRYLHNEFPARASEWTDPASRRTFLKLMGASIALAGASGCGIQPPEAIVPNVRSETESNVGEAHFFATSLPLGGFGHGVLVESHEYRPTKIEGNPAHPASLGGADPLLQAAILGLFDPDRDGTPTQNDRPSTWEDALNALIAHRNAQAAKKGAGLRILTGTVTSPTLGRLIKALLNEMPEAKWHQYEPVNADNARAGAVLAFGEPARPVHRFDRADVVLALDSDFLTWGPSRLVDARHFAGRRESVVAGSGPMNRLYAAEGTPTLTGAMADHRLAISAGKVPGLAAAIAAKVGVKVVGEAPGLAAEEAKWADAVAADLIAHKGSGLVLAGETQPAEVHALAHALNDALGNVGKTVGYIPPVEVESVDQLGSIRALTADMLAGKVGVLLILGVNPVFDAPADVDFAGGLKRVDASIHLAAHQDETSRLCEWHLPEAHPLESWGDLRAFDGSAGIVQPLIAPLFGGKSAIEVVGALGGQVGSPGLFHVRETWKALKPGDGFEDAWKTALHDGVVAGSASAVKSVTLKAPEGGFAVKPAGAKAGAFEVAFRPDPTIWDGSFANNGWLQELPKPLTKLTWDNALLLSPKAAADLKVKEGDLVEVELGGRTLTLPAWFSPGHADDSATIHLGYGRRYAGRVGSDAGFNAYAIRTSASPWVGAGATLTKTAKSYPMATTQHQQTMVGRDLVRVGTVDTFKKDNKFAKDKVDEKSRGLDLYSPMDEYDTGGWDYSKGHKWGMSINLNTCIGCNACVVACQSENNIPVVGKEQVIKGRILHWIRIDRYYEGGDGDEGVPGNRPGGIYHQPLTCMHCENAPCELVCPVEATQHDDEGLNVMTYNRCVGTRYCGNNCPYKVRRFNFLLYNDNSEMAAFTKNPQVSLRTRGVMEKCTYCIQRINNVRFASHVEHREMRRDEVVPACAQACPTRAIVFGDLNDKESSVFKAKADPRDYGLLEDLNTKPRTSYLARLRNPNTSIEAEPQHDGHAHA